MIIVAFIFTVVVLVVVGAQVAEYHLWARQALRAFYLLVGIAVMLVGVAMLLHLDFLTLIFNNHDARLGWLTLGTGLLFLLPLRLRGFSRWLWVRQLRLDRPIVLIVWGLMVFFLSSNVAVAITGSLRDTLPERPLPFLVLQNAFSVLVVLLGVGWGIRRSGTEVAQRLGLTRPTLQTVLLGISMALIMMISTGILGILLGLIFGSNYGTGDEFNRQIIERLSGAGGIVLMGVVTGIGEEMIFRGALQPVLGIVPTSLLFALSHAQYMNPSLLVIVGLGLLLGFTKKRWGLGTAILAHAVYNTLIALLALWAFPS